MRLFTLTLIASMPFCAGLEAQVSVVNGASFRSGQPVTQGSWVSALGTFPGVTDTVAPGGQIPTSLGGVTVSVQGVAAPVYFVSGGQINFLIPYETSPGLRTVQVKTSSSTVSGTVRVVTAAPGLFIKDTTQQVPPKGAIRNEDGAENTSSVPAHRGKVISIYATGPGALDQQVADGAGAPSQEPLARSVSTPQVYIGGVEAKVQFSGLAPGFAGLWQINAVVPNLSFLSGRVPVQVFMDGVDSNEVAVFVAQ
jgi:uncharacterized protein (TIGR03437 family)